MNEATDDASCVSGRITFRIVSRNEADANGNNHVVPDDERTWLACIQDHL